MGTIYSTYHIIIQSNYGKKSLFKSPCFLHGDRSCNFATFFFFVYYSMTKLLTQQIYLYFSTIIYLAGERNRDGNENGRDE